MWATCDLGASSEEKNGDMGFDGGYIEWNWTYRSEGRAIRPVFDPSSNSQ